MKQLTCMKCRAAQERATEAAGLLTDWQARVHDLEREERPRPWRVKVATHYAYIVDANGATVSSNGRTDASIAQAERICELANMLPPLTEGQVAEAALREIL